MLTWGLDAEDGLRSKARQPEATYCIHFILKDILCLVDCLGCVRHNTILDARLRDHVLRAHSCFFAASSCSCVSRHMPILFTEQVFWCPPYQ